MTAEPRRIGAFSALVALLGVLAATAPTSPAAMASVEESAPVAVAAVDLTGDVRPDGGGRHAGGPGEYVLYGTKWRSTDLTYGFANHTPDLSVASQEAAFARAFDSWAAVTPLRFRQVADCGLSIDAPACVEPDIRIHFVTGRHGPAFDPSLDGPGGTAAHAYFPPPNGASIAGDLHLDEGERWATTGSGVDLESVVLHELGHALGLDHAPLSLCPFRTSTTRPIMCATIIGIDRTVAPDDIKGVQFLYGVPGLSCAGRAVTVDLNEGDEPTAGPDVILGTPGADRIHSGRGADIVCGGGGADVIDLGPGNDRVLGGPGNDRVRGRSGNDRLEGGGGNDSLYGGNGRDKIFGGAGSDLLDGGAGADELRAGAQHDTCRGRRGRDVARSCERRESI